jgi:hypothetical protein
MSLFRRLFGGDKGVLGRKEVTTVEIHGRPLRCQVCGHPKFWRHDVQLNTRMAAFVNLDWMNAVATCAVCDNCGYIHWFIPPPAKE